MRIIYTFTIILISNALFAQNHMQKHYSEMKDGVFKSYYSNGNIELIGEIVNGKLEGDYISFRKDGDTLSHSYFVNGQFDGKSTMYDKKGRINSIVTYDKDKVVSMYEYWYFGNNKFNRIKETIIDTISRKELDEKVNTSAKSSNFHLTTTLKNSQTKGTLKDFYKNGQLKYFAQLKNLSNDGEVKTYSKDGTLLKTELWKNGKKLKLSSTTN